MTDREIIDTDIVIVGAGPAGLAAAIRLKQKSPQTSVTVVEKAAEIGGHILSGAVMDPSGLTELIPDWRARGAPVGPDVTKDVFHVLTRRHDVRLPNSILPPLMQTHDGVITSLGDLVRWLGAEAQSLGVDIFPMTAAVDVLTNSDGAVEGIITGDLGVDANGKPKPGYAAGIGLRAKYTLIGEGARGSLAKQIIGRFDLDAKSSPQKYGLGIKEIWEVPDSLHEPGRVDHYLGFPLDDATQGGGFLYHAQDRKIYLGLVVHLDYRNPALSPFDEFQRFKQHPSIARLLKDATRLSYGARALTSGGEQSIPELIFPGGALIGCAAGFMNAPRLKAIHSAIRSGIAAADSIAQALAAGRANDRLEDLPARTMASGIGRELHRIRNVKPLWSRFGTVLGVLLGGVDMWVNTLFRFSPFGTLKHREADADTLWPTSATGETAYPKPDGKLTFDRASSVFLANIAHDEYQPVHLQLADPAVPVAVTRPEFGVEPAPFYCPAGVYEMVEESNGPRFRVHPGNCVHCKTCDIKDPARNITWVPPEGGSGPNYVGM
ncbi:MAG: electron transfer flavoprotein-ubiquinone oxidoreductase [Devosia sp.]